MPTWKLNIFVSAILARYNRGEGEKIDILNSYTKLVESEKQEITNALN